MDHATFLAQGAWPDPLAPGYAPPSDLPPDWREALASDVMDLYRDSLRLPDKDVRASVLDDLSTCYDLPEDECVRRCLDWEQWSVREWREHERDSAEGLRDFYLHTHSWSFDHLWGAYLQAEGAIAPSSVLTALEVPRGARLRCLDFGSGVGDEAGLLAALGHDVDLADVSPTLLAFARFRLERHGVRAGYLDLNETELEPDTYDLVVAKDVLTHVPDFDATVTALHRTLRLGGLLLTNFDTRPPTPENAWHLYSDELPLRHRLADIGFTERKHLGSRLTVFGKVQDGGVARVGRRARNAVLYGPPRRAYRALHRLAGRALGR